MKEQNSPVETGRKLKKLLIVCMLVCYVPLTSGCVQYVMMGMMAVQAISGIVASQREDDGRREAWEKGEPYIRDEATSNWGTASSLAGLGGAITSFGARSDVGLWGQGSSNTGSVSGTSGQKGVGGGGQPYRNPDTGEIFNSAADLAAKNQGGTGINQQLTPSRNTYSGDTNGSLIYIVSGQEASAVEPTEANQTAPLDIEPTNVKIKYPLDNGTSTADKTKVYYDDAGNLLGVDDAEKGMCVGVPYEDKSSDIPVLGGTSKTPADESLVSGNSTILDSTTKTYPVGPIPPGSPSCNNGE